MRLRTLLFALAVAISPAGAQDNPFDMSGERPTVPPAGAVAPSQPAADTALPAADAAVPASAEPARRYILPFSQLVLAGENASRSWSIYLTQEQAAAKSTLNLGYQNAIIVAPEVSSLRLTLNGQELVATPIESPDSVSQMSVAIPDRLLHAGFNDIVVEAVQRHRTDCTIQSTYELWTQIDPARTFIAFDLPQSEGWKRFEDIRSIGTDETGMTRFNLIVPSMEQAVATAPMMKLAQALALSTEMPSQIFSISETGQQTTKPGSVNVVLATASELAKVLAAMPAGAATAPTATIVNDPVLGPSTLVVTGPDWQAIGAAVDDLGRQVDRPAGNQRTTLSSRSWRSPDIPMLTAASRLKFSELGVATEEFTGRRLRTDLAVGVPSDFYADSYGQATILLDAAYSSDVLPGSHIDVYVNDNIAATVPITTAGGEILRHLPIKVTMRHFRPGDNIIAIEAVLMTQADAVCTPGATGSPDKRFVLFDSSEFVMPDFARIGRIPNLAAVSGTGFPYNNADYSLPLIVDRAQPEAMSTAATLLARMAVSAGRLIPVDTTTSQSAVSDRNAMFVGVVQQIAPSVLAQLGVAADARAGWGETVASIKPETDATFDEWREKLRGRGWRGQVSLFEDWMNRTFNVSMDSFRLLPQPDPDFSPGGNATLLVAQQQSPSGQGAWTLVTAPSGQSLQDGLQALIRRDAWRQLDGHVATIDAANDKMSSVQTQRFEFIETQPFSIANYRLILANWLSANALAYALTLTLLSIVLGFATAGLLGSLGRRR